MINLLPPEEKRKLLSRKKEKLATVLCIVVLVSLVCLVLVLLSIKFYLLAATDYQKNLLGQFKLQTQTADISNFNGIIKKYNSTLAQLDSFYKKEIYFGNVLDIISNVQKPDGVQLINFSLVRNAAGIVQVNVSGISDTREDLLTFKTNIETDKNIKNPYFSPESWINPTNANFSLTFNIQNEQQ